MYIRRVSTLLILPHINCLGDFELTPMIFFSKADRFTLLRHRWLSDNPHISEPYVRIGCIWLSNILKKISGECSPIDHRRFTIANIPFLARFARSSTAGEDVSLVDRNIQGTCTYLQFQVTDHKQSNKQNKNHFTLRASCPPPPFLKTTMLDLSKFIIISRHLAVLYRMFNWVCRPITLSENKTTLSAVNEISN